jgi:phosphohistidine phosphatase
MDKRKKMKLHLLRHAKTNQISPTGKDFDRELLPKAYEQCAELKRYLQDHPIAPKHILCSSAVRTRQTLDQIKDLFADVPVTFLNELYLASAGELLKIINELQSPEDVLLIGHNEGISELASELSAGFILLKTCGLVSLEFPFESSAMVSKETGVLMGSFRVG